MTILGSSFQKYLTPLSGLSALADVTLGILSLLPPAPFSRGATARTRRRPKLRTGLAGVGGLNDPTAAAERFCRQAAAGAERQGFRTVHLVEMWLVDFRTGFTAGLQRG